ncbi:MAG: hypothetical protein FJ029_08180, partial [Actinobacteria bacterium]|nr:hypothetical protein [Actinomycetota bacterium]
MGYLALHILLNAVFGLSTRVAQTRGYDFFLVTGANYVLALLGAAVWAALQPVWRIDWTTALLGCAQGAQFASTIVAIYFLLVRTGVGITYALIRLSVVVPTLASILLFGESLRPTAIAGLVMLLAAVPLLSATASNGQRRLRWPAIALTGVTIAITGLGATAAKTFTEWRSEEFRAGYVVCVFAAATIVALVTFAGRRRLQPEFLPPLPGSVAAGAPPP